MILYLVGWLCSSSWLLLTSLASLTAASLLWPEQEGKEGQEKQEVEREEWDVWLAGGGEEDVEKVEWLNKAISQVRTFLQMGKHLKHSGQTRIQPLRFGTKDFH